MSLPNAVYTIAPEPRATILGTIAHEQDAFLELGPAEYEALKAKVPSLELAPSPRSGS
ncbi:hypothetical protein [Anaeromyxobacter dehalogenans]|uniref:hypothetical protein n=1 Tax=Anaeromyxobacter dehalogenans TaxID=161493 RepID=UPI000051B5DD|nr:hypothetical protein [Anaeromyxobacter dehalogenans]